jgi:hypothetical protein
MNRMKFLLAMIGAGLLVSGWAHAQEPPLPAKTETPAPSPSPSGRPQLTIPEIPIEPPQLVPDSASPGSGASVPAKTAPPLSQLDTAFQKSPLGQAAEEYRLHIEWRQLQNRTVDDPEVLAAKKAVAAAKTDVEKRVRLRAYYNIFYAHMQALTTAPDVKSYLDGQKAALLSVLAQPRVRPEASPKPSPAH